MVCVVFFPYFRYRYCIIVVHRFFSLSFDSITAILVSLIIVVIEDFRHLSYLAQVRYPTRLLCVD